MNKYLLKIKKDQSGTALLMTLLILNAVIIISLASAGLISSGIKMSSSQAKSSKAYFAAESGAEEILWQWRKNNWAFPDSNQSGVFSGNLSNGSSYEVDYASSSPQILFRSKGDYLGLKRTVELELNF